MTDSRWKIFVALVLVVFLPLGCSGCDDEIGSDDCPGDEDCTLCEAQDDCDEDSYCDMEAGICVPTECSPGETLCEDDGVVTCDSLGSGFGDPVACSTGVCESGECGCGDVDDCAPGHQCMGGSCVCSSGVTCGGDGTCCGDGESCAEVQICDEDDENCETLSICRPECEGSVCGLTGDLCCEGDTPNCGPDGQCAPSCDGLGELCGEDFDECCDAGDLCIFGECRTPGDSCSTFSECDFGEYCDPGLGRCMPDDFPEDLVCELDFDFEDFESEFLWHWDGVTVDGSLYDNVAVTPMVADMTGDGVPEVVFNAYSGNVSSQHMPVVISGATGETIYYNNARWARTWGQVALVDITGNGLPEIVTGNSEGVGVIKNIVECDEVTATEDCYLWWTTDARMVGESLVVADVTADGNVEIVVNDRVLDGLTGDLIAQTGDRGYDYTVVADITGDGKMEILSERRLLALDDGDLVELWSNPDLPAPGMRFAAVGDVASEGPDGDRRGEPEFVITGDGNVYVVAGETGDILHQFSVPGGGSGGPPIIADFDGDGNAEFGIAGSGCYTVFDLDCLGPADEDQEGCTRPVIEPCTQGVDCFDVEMCPALSATGGTGDGILWSVYIQDISSSRTGSSVFDFQGNGRNEVVYNDECLLMVLDGQNGSPLFRYPNTTRTASEYPIVVDVNGDTRTNFVVAANNDQFNRDCRDPIQARPDRYPECHGDGPFPEWCTQGTTGIFALQDPEDRWVRTRQIWNQFSYHIDNVTDDARAPTSPPMPWETHNTFRANRQGEVPLNAPDVVISSVQANQLACPPDIDFQVTVRNNGKSAIPSGLPVSLFDADTNQILETINIGQPISPGGTVVVSFSYTVPQSRFNQELNFVFVANEDGSSAPLVQDCNPETATAVVEPLVCRITL